MVNAAGIIISGMRLYYYSSQHLTEHVRNTAAMSQTAAIATVLGSFAGTQA
jgi:hypothetical protein